MHSRALVFGRIAALLLSFLFFAQFATSQAGPKVKTDKPNYKAGETVKITGSDWTPGEIVSTTITQGENGAQVTVDAAADETGAFTATYTVPDVDQAVTFDAAATGQVSHANARIEFTGGGDVFGSGDLDPDLPGFVAMGAATDKDDYLRRREEHVNRLRGVHPDKTFDPAARGRAIKQMNRQEGRNDRSTSTVDTAPNQNGGTTGGSPSTLIGLSGSSGPLWSPIGPSPLPNGQTFSVTQPVSGRTVAIAIHPSNSNIAYVGAAQGGVYRTLDGGATWTPILDNANTLAIGSIAIAPSQPSTIYVGTGELNNSCDSFFGVGVYRIDNADSANPVVSGPFNLDLNGNDVFSGRSIGKVLVHPANPDIIFVGSGSGISGIGGCAGIPGLDGTSTSQRPRGLFRAVNATSSDVRFTKLTMVTANGGNRSVTDAEFEPGNPNTLLATSTGFSTAGDGGVFVSTNALATDPAAVTFTRTLPTGSATSAARVEIAVQKAAGQPTGTFTVFAGLSDSSGTLKRSTDGGQTWSAALSGATGFCGGQCTYDMPIAVDFTDPNIVYLGGAADGSGNTGILIKSTNAMAASPTFAKRQNGLHADSHAIEIDPSNHNTVWFGSDGGIWRSFDAAQNWASVSTVGYVATQFQSVAVHPTDQYFTIGGTQDNGTEFQRPDNTWVRGDFGDGGFALIDQSATNTTNVTMYHTYFNQTNNLIALARVTNTANAQDNGWAALGCGATANGLNCADAVNFYAPMALGPGTPNTLYFGTDKLYRSSNQGTTMTAVSQVFSTGIPVSSISISPQNDNVRLVGLNNGKVFRTMSGATTLTDVSAGIPSFYIARAVIDPNDQNTAYVTLSGYFGNSNAHIYKTTNLGASTPTWTGIGGGVIPDVPVNAFAVDPADSNSLYAGTDIGVYHSADGGATWVPYSNGLPRVAVFDMAIQNTSRILRIATHGRGMWEISVANPNSFGSLQGTAKDSVGNTLAGVVVTASRNTMVNTTTTDASGAYSFAALPPGTYTVTGSIAGFNSATATAAVAASASTTRDLTLTSAAVGGCIVDTTQIDFQAGVPIDLDLTSSPGDAKLQQTASAIDQQQTTLNFFVDPVTNTTWQAQTFTAGVSGKLTQVDFEYARLSTSASGVVVMEIHNTVGGVPGPQVLYAINISGITSTGNAFYSIPTANGPALSAGTQYAIVTYTQPGLTYRAVRSTGNSYAAGAWFTSTNSGATWTAQTSDLAFRTYIQPATVLTVGELTSSLKDANPLVGSNPAWGTLSWTATTPAGTSIRFQAAASDNASGPFNFVGPDGTSASYYTGPGSLAQFNGHRYLKYKAYFSTSNASVTPVLSDVTICFNDIAPSSLAVAPASGTYGGATTLSATLTSRGSGVSGKTVAFKLNGSDVGSGVTDANGIASVSGVSLSGINAGSYPGAVSASYDGGTDYAPASGSADLTVNKADQTISFAPLADKTYGDPDFTVSATASTGFTVTFSATGSCSVSGTTVHIHDAGSCTVTASQAGDSNYNPASASQTFNVAQAALIVTANNASKLLNAPNPAFTATLSGFAAGDTSSALTGALSCTSTATQTSPVGTYPITCSGLNSANYAIQYVPGTLTVAYAAGGACYGDAGHSILAPVSPGGTSVFKAGSTVPAKFRVCDANGVSQGTAGVVSSFRLVGMGTGTLSTTDSAVASTTPDTAFRWDPTAQQWIFNMDTKGLAAGATYQYRIGLNDGSSITFQFGLR